MLGWNHEGNPEAMLYLVPTTRLHLIFINRSLRPSQRAHIRAIYHFYNYFLNISNYHQAREQRDSFWEWNYAQEERREGREGRSLERRFVYVSPSFYNPVKGTGCRPSPLPLRVTKSGRNTLNEKISPHLPTGIAERYIQTISNLGHAALLRRCELPL
jgi:hypothetical protein